MIRIVAAMGKNREIGRGNELLWHIPDDLKRFKRLTLGHPVIMGRKTFESIINMRGKPLPGRTNIVITRNPDWNHEGVISAQSLGGAIERAKEIDAREIFIIGGAQIYEQALPVTAKLYLTLIDDSKNGDAFFPSYEHLFKKVFEERREWNGLHYMWVDLEKN